MTVYSASYSPDDNKLRMRASSRLDTETYQRLQQAGFQWAPRQQLFVAPMWTPAREDLLLELAGAIGDEDETLCQRAENRAERFTALGAQRSHEAAATQHGVHAIAERFAGGQPILVGHHSEARARKDAQRMDQGMRRALQLWDTASYWERRAAAARAHAQYKQLPGVRARRIQGLEADQRQQARSLAQTQVLLALWQCENLSLDQALQIAQQCDLVRRYSLTEFPRLAPASQYEGEMGLWSALSGGVVTAEQARALAIPALEHARLLCARWLDHVENRLRYERVLLTEQGGLQAERFALQAGGRVLIGGEWLVVVRVNRRDGHVCSVRTSARHHSLRLVAEIQDYRPPSEQEAQIVAALTQLPPLVNYPGPGFVAMSRAEWEKVPKDYRGTQTLEASASHARHRVRHCLGVYCLKAEQDINLRHSYPCVFISDAKRMEPPPVVKQASAEAACAEPAEAEKVSTPQICNT